MGAINEVFIQNKISFSNIEDFLKILTRNNEHNLFILHEIGLIKEFSNVKSDKLNTAVNSSKKYKTIKNIIKSSKLRENFVNWVKILFDIKEIDFSSFQYSKQKMGSFKKNTLNKAFFQSNIKNYLFKNNLINQLLKYGIPNNIRELVWDVAIGEKYANHKYFNFEEEKKCYACILKRAKTNQQIEKDLDRTFIIESEATPNNKQKLRNVLNCINKYNNGYCQGMNFIAGFLLKITNYDEIRTFYIFKNILNYIKGYFQNGFPLLKQNLNIFDKYFQILYPKVYQHFQKLEIYKEFWVGKWLQTLFTLSIPFSELSNIWDILIIFGFDYIIFISLAIVGLLEDELLDLNDSSDILNYLKCALNPKDKKVINKEEFEDVENYIIPLHEILSKAIEIEEKITKKVKNVGFLNNDKNFKNCNEINNQNREIYNDTDSECTKCTKSSDSTNINNSMISYFSPLNKPHLERKSTNLVNAQTHVNNIKNNLCHTKFGINNNNNLNNKNSNINPNSNINLNTTNVNTNTNLSKNIYNNLNNIRTNYKYNINYPNQPRQYAYNNNNINYINYSNTINYTIINNRIPQYSNFSIYYA